MNIRIGLLLFLTISIAGSVVRAQTPDAYVESIKGTAWVTSGNSKPIRLKENSGLYSDQRISCGSGCNQLAISYCSRTIRVILPKGSTRLIRSINCGFVKGRQRGGGAKGESASIISPKESQRVQPGTFLVRWKPFSTAAKTELSLKIYLGEGIWGPEIVGGSSGSYSSNSLRAALRASQKTNHLVLVLTLDNKKDPSQRVKFYLVSTDDEKKLEKGLDNFTNETDPIVRAIGRGSLFGEYELYAEAASEFERAARTAERQKTDAGTLGELMTLAIQANYLGYNDDRVQELCKLWKLASTPLPEACSKIR